MASRLGVAADMMVKTRYRICKKADRPEGADQGETFAPV